MKGIYIYSYSKLKKREPFIALRSPSPTMWFLISVSTVSHCWTEGEEEEEEEEEYCLRHENASNVNYIDLDLHSRSH